MFKEYLRKTLNKKIEEDYNSISSTRYKDDLLINKFKERLDKATISFKNLAYYYLLENPFIILFKSYIDEYRPELANKYQGLFEE